MRRRHPNIGVLIAPAAQDVQVRAASALVENRARLNVQRDIDGFLLHRLRDAELFKSERHHRFG
jgi:hypothetical protein